MPINVTCPNCLKRFSVSDKFAGKSGPCPNCQKTIKIPEKADEVVIHAPADSGPTDSAGKSILKPLRRKEVNIGTPVLVGAGLGTFAVFVIALGMGLSGQQPPTAVLVAGSVLLAFPLVYLGYWFLRDDELEGYSGQALWLRCGICALAFAGLWALYAFVPRYVSGYEAMEEYSGLDLVIFLPLMLVLGTIIAVSALELEAVQGALHYALYLGVTFVLAWLAGAHLAAPLSGDLASPVNSSPGASSPGPVSPDGNNPVTQPAEDAQDVVEPAKPEIPKVLQ